jgi:PAT family beta-lactamase induction signal transducer AmpG
VPPFLAVYAQRKMLALLLLGFSSGLPAVLVGATLQSWLTGAGIDVATIGWLSLIALPYAAKPLWAPFVDRFALPFLGRRRGWLLATQIAIALALWGLSTCDPALSLPAFLVAATTLAFLSATQDIVVDAYRSDILEEREVGAGVAGYVLGFRVAMVVAASIPLRLATQQPWPEVYLIMSGFVAIGVAGTLLAPEPVAPADPPRGAYQVIVLPFLTFLRRRGVGGTAAVLAFAVLYKLGDQLLGNVIQPFLLRELRFPGDLVGDIQGGVGVGATVVGALTGGAVLSRIGIERSLWVFGVLQAGSNVGYWLLARVGPDARWLAGVIAIENFCGGLATAAFLGFLLRQCDARFSATQFALLSGLMTLGRTLLAAPAGSLVARIGWEQFFLLSIVAAVPGLLLLPFFAPWRKREQTV